VLLLYSTTMAKSAIVTAIWYDAGFGSGSDYVLCKIFRSESDSDM